MVIVTKKMVLEVYHSLLNGTLSYPDADRWAWNMMQEYDKHNLEYAPREDEGVIRELITYLYGIDMPSMEDRSKTGRTNDDIIDFLKAKNLYE